MSDPYARAPTANPGRADLLDPGSLAKLGDMELIARRVVEGFLLGLHRSPHRGFSAEFAELHAYRPGDDLRYIDWRMFGRSNRYYVKRFQEETNLRAYLLLDLSGSMDWSSNPGELPTKSWYASHLAAALAHTLIRQGDQVGLVAFDEEIRHHVRPRGGPRQLRELLLTLTSAESGGRTAAEGALREAALRLRRRGLVILLSDLLLEAEPTRQALHFLRHRGHEVIVLHLLDPGERDLPSGGDVRFFDPETGDEMGVNVPDVRSEYRSAVNEAVAEWRGALRPHGIEYGVIGTEQPLASALRRYLQKRQRLG